MIFFTSFSMGSGSSGLEGQPVSIVCLLDADFKQLLADEQYSDRGLVRWGSFCTSPSISHDFVLDMVFNPCCIWLISEIVSSAETTDPLDSIAIKLCVLTFSFTKFACSDKFEELEEVTIGVGGSELLYSDSTSKFDSIELDSVLARRFSGGGGRG